MKTSRIILTPFLILLTIFSLTAQWGDIIQWEQEDLICKEQERGAFHLHQRGLRNAFSDQTDIFYQEMHWDIDPAQNYIKGEITYHFTSRTADLTTLHLDLSNSLQVSCLCCFKTVSGNQLLLSFQPLLSVMFFTVFRFFLQQFISQFYKINPAEIIIPCIMQNIIR